MSKVQPKAGIEEKEFISLETPDPRDQEIQDMGKRLEEMEKLIRFSTNPNKMSEFDRNNKETGNMRVHIPLFPDADGNPRVIVDYGMKDNHVYAGHKGINEKQTILATFERENGEKYNEIISLEDWTSHLIRSEKIAVDWIRHVDDTELTEKELHADAGGSEKTIIGRVPTKPFKFALTYNGKQYVFPKYLANA